MIDKRDLEHTDLSGKLLKGIVVVNKDPLKLDRIKVYIKGLFPESLKTNTEYLPWIMSINSMSSSNCQCNVNIPDINSECYVLFPTNDAYSGIYISSVPNVAQEFLEDYPYCYGRIDRSGTLFIANTNNDTYMIYHSSGTCLTVDGFGKVKIQVANSGDANANAKSLNPYGLSLEVVGDINLDCSRNVNMHCKSFNVDATDSIIFKTKDFQINSSNVSVKNSAGITISTSTYSMSSSSNISLSSNTNVLLSGTSMTSLYGGVVTLGNPSGGMLSNGGSASMFDSYKMKEYTVITEVDTYKFRAFEYMQTPAPPGQSPQQLPVNVQAPAGVTAKNIVPKPNRVRQAYVEKGK